MSCFETNFGAMYIYFTAEPRQLKNKQNKSKNISVVAFAYGTGGTLYFASVAGMTIDKYAVLN